MSESSPQQTPDLKFTVVDVRAEKHAAVPTLSFQLRIADSSATPIHTIMLRAQLQIQPRQRGHTPAEQDRLFELFGEYQRWGDTLRPLLWTQTTLIVPAFQGEIEVDLPVACTYDFEVASAKYLEALEDGEVPLLFLFSGTIFAKSGAVFRVAQVPWDCEASFRMPVKAWRELMDAYFPGCCWIRLQHESLDLLQQFKARRALLTWDDVIRELVNNALLKAGKAAR